MTPEAPANAADPLDDAELGPPIAELRDLSLPLGTTFPDRVRGRIERRLITGELLELAWTAPLMVLIELLQAPLQLLRGRRRP